MITVYKQPRQRAWFAGRAGLVLTIFLVVAAFFLVTEHRAYLFGYWLLILMLLCLGIVGFLFAWDLREERKMADQIRRR